MMGNWAGQDEAVSVSSYEKLKANRNSSQSQSEQDPEENTPKGNGIDDNELIN